MEQLKDGTCRVNEKMPPLIFGLPDDIALSCLARVPRKFHTVLKCACRRWRDLVCSEEWLDYRRKHNLSETWIYALCMDTSNQLRCYELDPNSSRRSWRLMPQPCCLRRNGMGFEVLGRKIYLLGGCEWSKDAIDEAYCFDVLRNSWTEAASLSTARCFFACEVLGGKIYAIGGYGSKSSDQQTWDYFDPNTERWESHSDASVVSDIEDSVVLDGKIYIRCGSSPVSSHVCGVVYEPSSDTWQHADSDMMSGWQGPAVVVDDNLYVLDQRFGTRLMRWQKNKREWVAVGRLSMLLTRPPCRLVAIRKKIFILGRGLSTVVLNTEETGIIDGVMVSSSIPSFDDVNDVIRCKCLAL